MSVKSAARRIQRAIKTSISSRSPSVQAIDHEHISSESKEGPYKEKLKTLLLRSCYHLQEGGAQINPKEIKWIASKESEEQVSWEDFAEGRIDRQFQIGRITNFFT